MAASFFAGSFVPRTMFEEAWDDEGNDRQAALDLFDAFGSREKRCGRVLRPASALAAGRAAPLGQQQAVGGSGRSRIPQIRPARVATDSTRYVGLDLGPTRVR